MSEFTISLIIPAYNEEKYIGECLDSAIKNSHGRFSEIFVIDNASTDNTRAVAEKRPGIKVITESQKGVMRARQRGYVESKGDILVFLDADTQMPEGWLDTVMKQFKEKKDMACLSGPYIYYDMSKFSQFLIKIYWRTFAVPVYWLVGYMSVFGNFAIRRDVVDKMGGFDTTIEFYGDDTNTARRASKFGRVVFLHDHYMYSSGRRLIKQGIFSIFKEYGLNFISEVLWHKPITVKYKDFR